MEHLSLYPVIIPDTFDSWVKWFATLKIDSDSVSIGLFLLRIELGQSDRSMQRRKEQEKKLTLTCRATTASWTSKPPFAARVFGMIRRASANA